LLRREATDRSELDLVEARDRVDQGIEIANSRAADFPISSVNRGSRVEPSVDREGKVRLPRAGRNAF
jgi:hypothetical protein